MFSQGHKAGHIAKKLNISIATVYTTKSQVKKEGILSGILKKAGKPQTSNQEYGKKKDELYRAYDKETVDRVVDLALIGTPVEDIMQDENVEISRKDVETIIKHLELEGL